MKRIQSHENIPPQSKCRAPGNWPAPLDLDTVREMVLWGQQDQSMPSQKKKKKCHTFVFPNWPQRHTDRLTSTQCDWSGSHGPKFQKWVHIYILYLFIYFIFIYLYYLSIPLFIYLFVCLFVYLFIYLFIFIYLFNLIYLFIYLFVCVFVYLFI